MTSARGNTKSETKCKGNDAGKGKGKGKGKDKGKDITDGTLKWKGKPVVRLSTRPRAC